MKELKLFESWAEGILSEAAPTSKNDSSQRALNARPVEFEYDTAKQAMLKYPGMSKEQAINRYLLDTVSAIDNQVKKAANDLKRQEKENIQLKNKIADFENGNNFAPTPAVVSKTDDKKQEQEQTDKRLVSSDEVELMKSNLKQIQQKPDVDKKEYDGLVKRVGQLEGLPVNNKEIVKIQDRIQTIVKEPYVDNAELDKFRKDVQQTIQDAKAELGKEAESQVGQQATMWGLYGIKDDLTKAQQEIVDINNKLANPRDETIGTLDERITRIEALLCRIAGVPVQHRAAFNSTQVLDGINSRFNDMAGAADAGAAATGPGPATGPGAGGTAANTTGGVKGFVKRLFTKKAQSQAQEPRMEPRMEPGFDDDAPPIKPPPSQSASDKSDKATTSESRYNSLSKTLESQIESIPGAILGSQYNKYLK
jgi:hypothetical protein